MKHGRLKIASQYYDYINVGQAPTVCLLLSDLFSQWILKTMGKYSLSHCREDTWGRTETQSKPPDSKAFVLPSTAQNLSRVDSVGSPLSSLQICLCGAPLLPSTCFQDRVLLSSCHQIPRQWELLELGEEHGFRKWQGRDSKHKVCRSHSPYVEHHNIRLPFLP